MSGAATGFAARARRLAARPAYQTFGATVAITGINFITGAILARALLPAGRGELAAAILWPSLLRWLTMLGVTNALTYRAARPDVKLGSLIGTAYSLAAVQDVAFIVLGLGLLPIILSDYSSTTVVASLIYLGTLAFGTFGTYQLAILNGIHRYTAYNVFRALAIAIGAVAMTVLAVLDELTVTTAVLCYLAGVGPTTLAGARWVARGSGGVERGDRGLARWLLSYGWRSQFGANPSNPLISQLDQLVVSIFLSPLQLGLYVVAYHMTLVIGFVSATASVIALPSTARTDDPAVQRLGARRKISLTFAFAVAIAIPLAFVAGPVIELVFGPAFAGATDTTRILLGAAVLTAPTHVAVAVLSGMNRPGEAGIAGVLSMAGTAIGLALFIPPLGIEGAALGVVLGYTLSLSWSLVRLGRALGISPLRLLVPMRVPSGFVEDAAGAGQPPQDRGA